MKMWLLQITVYMNCHKSCVAHFQHRTNISQEWGHWMWILQTILKITPARPTLKFSAVSPCRYTTHHHRRLFMQFKYVALNCGRLIANCITRNNLLFAKCVKWLKQHWWPTFLQQKQNSHYGLLSSLWEKRCNLPLIAQELKTLMHSTHTAQGAGSPHWRFNFKKLSVLRKMSQISALL